MNMDFKYKTVLLIDDSEMDNFINQKIMESTHFAKTIYVCTSGLSAMEFVRNLVIAGENKKEILPDIIFVDLNMPIRDGFTFIEDLKKEIKDEMPMPKIIILSSSVNPLDKKRAEEIGNDIVFLNKPLSGEVLEYL